MIFMILLSVKIIVYISIPSLPMMVKRAKSTSYLIYPLGCGDVSVLFNTKLQYVTNWRSLKSRSLVPWLTSSTLSDRGIPMSVYSYHGGGMWFNDALSDCQYPLTSLLLFYFLLLSSVVGAWTYMAIEDNCSKGHGCLTTSHWKTVRHPINVFAKSLCDNNLTHSPV